MGIEGRRVEICQTHHRFIDGHLARDRRARPLTGIDPMHRRFIHSVPSRGPSLLAASSSTAFLAAAFFAADFLAAAFLAGAVERGGSLAGETRTRGPP